MTKSVADLYDATRHINRGDLTHRIQVRTQDQMAALEQSFNSMTESLSKLIAEQKEKQRLEGELAIAHEVQNLLFPADLSGLATLEVHGVCRPARTVSGDYYDFIPLREDKLMLAVGDISGKGISAALLMATVHAFVRAYSLEPERTLAVGRHRRRCRRKQRPSHVLPQRRQRRFRTFARGADGHAELPALPQHAAGEIRHHVPRLLRCGLALADLFQRRTSASAGAERQGPHHAAGNFGHRRRPVRRHELSTKARSSWSRATSSSLTATASPSRKTNLASSARSA